jgi:hypothetical protein
LHAVEERLGGQKLNCHTELRDLADLDIVDKKVRSIESRVGNVQILVNARSRLFRAHEGIMTPFERHVGKPLSLDRDNIDTDAIIPKQFMKSISRAGLGPHAFDAW